MTMSERGSVYDKYQHLIFLRKIIVSYIFIPYRVRKMKWRVYCNFGNYIGFRGE